MSSFYAFVQQTHLGVFQWNPEYFCLKMEPAPTCAFPLIGILSECFSWALGVLNRILPSPSVFQLGGNSLGIFPTEPYPVSRSCRYFLVSFHCPTPPTTLLRGSRYLVCPMEIKFWISISMGDPRTRRLTQSVWNSWGSRCIRGLCWFHGSGFS